MKIIGVVDRNIILKKEYFFLIFNKIMIIMHTINIIYNLSYISISNISPIKLLIIKLLFLNTYEKDC